MHRDDNATDMHWNRHVGLTYTEPETGEDGIDFGAVASDGRKYRFHLETNALKALNAEAFYDDDLIERVEAPRDNAVELRRHLFCFWQRAVDDQKFPDV